MTRRVWPWLCFGVGVALAGVQVVSPGCEAKQATQGVALGASSQPSASHETTIVEQAGQGNVSAHADVPVNASGWTGTGLSYNSAVPVGQVALMGLMLWLSHRREVLRIRGSE
jgi:3-dehydroquinate dehydratase